MRVKGDVDSSTVDELTAHLTAALKLAATHPARLVVVDLQAVDFFGSAGVERRARLPRRSEGRRYVGPAGRRPRPGASTDPGDRTGSHLRHLPDAVRGAAAQATAMNQALPADLAAAVGLGGEMGRRFAEFDWAAHPLGSPQQWSAEVRAAVAVDSDLAVSHRALVGARESVLDVQRRLRADSGGQTSGGPGLPARSRCGGRSGSRFPRCSPA